MKTQYPIYIFIALLSSSMFGQATLTVDEFALFKENLSIGVNTNAVELEIHDTDNDTDVLIDFNTTTKRFITGINVSSGNFYGTTTMDKYSFITDNVVRMILTPEGFLGIGTPGPQDRFHVREDGIIGDLTAVMTIEAATSKIPVLKFDEGGDLGMGIKYDGTGSGVNNKMHIMNTITANIATFTNGGKVGLKEENPEEALDIDGNMVIDGSGTINELRFYDGASVKAKLAYDGQVLSLENSSSIGTITSKGLNDSEIEGSGDILLDAEDRIFFITDVSTKGVLNPTGLFGINTTNPDGMFHVRAFGNSSALRLESNVNSNHWSFRAKNDLLELHYNGIVKGLYNGNTGQYSIVSDRRLKENITAIENGVLDKLKQLEATEYYFIHDKQKNQKSMGFIAQDIFKVFPQVVTEPESEDDFYKIDYSSISILAIKALQEQQKELDWLKNEIARKHELKEKVENYKLLAQGLQAQLNVIENYAVKE